MKIYKSKISRYTLVCEPNTFQKVKIETSKDVEAYLRQFYATDIEIWESFFILLLSQNNTTTGWAKISQGGTTATIVDVTLIAKYAVETLARGVIICHNHPSGNATASQSDIILTEKVKNALALFDIKLLDHVILTVDDFVSLADTGLL